MLVSLFVALLSFQTHAFPEAPFNALDRDFDLEAPSALRTPLPFETAYDFEGIVKLSNCSGSVVRFKGQPTTDQALVLTNGHCLGGRFMKPGEVIEDRFVQRRMRIFNKERRSFSYWSERIVYATMTGTDAALYRLKKTYDDIQAEIGVTPFILSDTRPLDQTDIDIVSGYWSRGYSCFINGFAFKLLEAGWIFRDSIRYSDSGCEIIGGTSGSPVIERGTRSVIGVNNTKNENGRECTMNNPCEVSETGEQEVRYGTGYGQQTYLFYSCLTPDYQIDLSVEGCQLARPQQEQ